MSHSCSRPHPCLSENIMPRITEYQSPVSGLFPHCLSDRQSDGASGHVSASIGLRLSPPRPAARARVLSAACSLTLPGLATAWLGFRAGGFFAGQVGLVASGAGAGRSSGGSRSRDGRSKAGVPRSHWLPARLAGLAVWTLASASWSDAPARALSEFDRTLLYGLVLVLTGSVAARVGDLAMLLRWTAAAFAAIALAGLLDPAAAGHVPDLERLPARAGLVPAHLLERDGRRLRARGAAASCT